MLKFDMIHDDKYIPVTGVLQVAPVKPAVHAHVKEDPLTEHAPPFRQGLALQGSRSRHHWVK